MIVSGLPVGLPVALSRQRPDVQGRPVAATDSLASLEDSNDRPGAGPPAGRPAWVS